MYASPVAKPVCGLYGSLIWSSASSTLANRIPVSIRWNRLIG
jgi:hypothetical protein